MAIISKYPFAFVARLHIMLSGSYRHLVYDAHQAGAPQQMGATSVDSSAFETFVHAHERQIVNYLWRMTGEEQVALDLAQETFLRAWEHFTQIHTYNNPRAWLFRVATNLALTYRTRRASPIGAATPFDEDFGPATSDPARRVVESEMVRQTLQALSPKRRATLVLREVYGMSAGDISQILNMTTNAVKTTLCRAREQFREIYEREGEQQ